MTPYECTKCRMPYQSLIGSLLDCPYCGGMIIRTTKGVPLPGQTELSDAEFMVELAELFDELERIRDGDTK